MAKILPTPESIQIKPRRLNLQFEGMTKNFIDENPVLTAICCALSSVFPSGERQFIASVRHYQNDVTDPELKKRIRAFIGQEAHHGNEHDTFNEKLRELGWRTDVIEKQSMFMDKHLGKFSTPEQRLAQTAALEHLTAIFANYILSDPDKFLGNTHPEVRKLFLWHAVEETEHKSVAYDVYQTVIGDDKIRCSEMKKVLPVFAAHMFESTIYLLIRNRELFSFNAWKEAYSALFNKQTGMFPNIRQELKDYQDDNFHPWQHDNSDLTQKWIDKLELAV